MRLVEKIEINPKLAVEDSWGFDFLKMHEKSVTDFKNKPPKPKVLISIGRDDKNSLIKLATAGNISVILGAEKSRKTWFKNLIIACAFGGESWRHSEIIKGHDIGDKYIVNIDTEQGSYDSWIGVNRVASMVGGNDSKFCPDNFINVSLREYTPDQRLGYLNWLVYDSPYKGKIAIIFIDGIVDLMTNSNEIEESLMIVQKLMTLSTVGDLHICSVLHTTANTDKGRGHLGTIIAQKAESVILIKNEGKTSSVIASRMRNGGFETNTLSIGGDYLPYLEYCEIEDPKSFSPSDFNKKNKVPF
jgi:hypothetical protein